MKRRLILCFTLLFLLFAGCSNHQMTCNFNELSHGDFSSISGTYTNPDGELIQLDEDGLRWFEVKTREVQCSEDGFCSMGIHQKGIPDAGYSLSIYLAGREIEGLNTDTSKIRICYGQAEPMSEQEIYTYTSNKLTPVVIESDYQAFMMKEYYDVLNECSLNYGLFNPSVKKNLVMFTGPDLQSTYDMKEHIYHLTLRQSFSYSKNDELKTATLEISTDVYDSYVTETFGKLSIIDGQQFSISYDDALMQMTNAISNKPLTFVDDLQHQLIALFEDAEIIGKLHAEVLRSWTCEIQKVESSKKPLDSIKNARDIELNTSILENQFHSSINQYELTDPCAAAMEITRYLMNNRQGVLDFTDIDSSKITSQNIFWDALDITLFEGNQHFPYSSLIRRNSNFLYVLTFKDLKQFAYELYGVEFVPFIPDEWSSIYNHDFNRYESSLEFGLRGEGPDTTFNITNMRAEQTDSKILVSFDIEWFDKDGDWSLDKEMTILHGSAQYVVMSEDGHSFLRHIYTDFQQ